MDFRSVIRTRTRLRRRPRSLSVRPAPRTAPSPAFRRMKRRTSRGSGAGNSREKARGPRKEGSATHRPDGAAGKSGRSEDFSGRMASRSCTGPRSVVFSRHAAVVAGRRRADRATTGVDHLCGVDARRVPVWGCGTHMPSVRAHTSARADVCRYDGSSRSTCRYERAAACYSACGAGPYWTTIFFSAGADGAAPAAVALTETANRAVTKAARAEMARRRRTGGLLS